MDCMDYNYVALERMVAYMHLDKVMPQHLDKEEEEELRKMSISYHSYQVQLVVVEHHLMEPMVVVDMDMVEQYLVDMLG